ncbi:something about silencing protein 10-like [Paramacrobiotus metropolitanus]|uniref:something about silencing protein 10-like n=1 Tax=Paramacrobiotus metropolitanus TaxID=2943436 RepID=UPI0024458619|nr:something about silencing protein 10-like [Paramacrobiotus metropolitanus]
MGKFARKNQKELRLEAKKKARGPKKVTAGENVMEKDDGFVDPDAEDFIYDDVDRHHQQKHKDNMASGFQFEEEDESDNEEEVLPVGGESSEDEEDDSEEDAQNDEEEGLPNRSAWGTKRSAYYQTDFVDKDHGKFLGSDAEEAEEEEREARELRAKMTAELTEDDFGLTGLAPLETPSTNEALDAPVVTETTALDISKLTELEKMERLKQESPELLDLIADGKRKMSELTEIWNPLFSAVTKTDQNALTDRAERYVKTKYQLVLGYCQNIAFYLSLKAKRVSMDNHPVTRRLVDFRKLFIKLEPLDKLYSAEMKRAVAALKNGQKLQSLRRKAMKTLLTEKRVKFMDDIAAKPAITKEKPLSQRVKETPASAEDDDEMEVDEENPNAGDVKRAVTYQIAKNKGITPYRKKEYRNPRVKHRMKYRKALISRKGQVKEHRPELRKYGGEISGIRAGVIKSRKLK